MSKKLKALCKFFCFSTDKWWPCVVVVALLALFFLTLFSDEIFTTFFAGFSFTATSKAFTLLGGGTAIWAVAFLGYSFFKWPENSAETKAGDKTAEKTDIKSAEQKGKKTAVKAVVWISFILLLSCYLAYFLVPSPRYFLSAFNAERIAVLIFALVTVFWAAWRTTVTTIQADNQTKQLEVMDSNNMAELLVDAVGLLAEGEAETKAIKEKNALKQPLFIIESNNRTEVKLGDSETKKKAAVALLKQIGLSGYEHLSNSALSILEDQLQGQTITADDYNGQTTFLGECCRAVEEICKYKNICSNVELIFESVVFGFRGRKNLLFSEATFQDCQFHSVIFEDENSYCFQSCKFFSCIIDDKLLKMKNCTFFKCKIIMSLNIVDYKNRKQITYKMCDFSNCTAIFIDEPSYYNFEEIYYYKATPPIPEVEALLNRIDPNLEESFI